MVAPLVNKMLYFLHPNLPITFQCTHRIQCVQSPYGTTRSRMVLQHTTWRRSVLQCTVPFWIRCEKNLNPNPNPTIILLQQCQLEVTMPDKTHFGCY